MVDDGSTPLLIECGISIKRIREGLGFKLSEIGGCLVSHLHGDHCNLKTANALNNLGIVLYGSVETLQPIESLNFLVHPFDNLDIGSWRVLSFPVKHDCLGVLGFVLDSKGERLVYITDTPYSRFTFPGTTHLMIEANYDAAPLRENVASGEVDKAVKRRVIGSHMSLETVKDMLRANDLSRLQEIWLLHLSDSNSDAERFRREIQELTGKVVKIA